MEFNKSSSIAVIIEQYYSQLIRTTNSDQMNQIKMNLSTLESIRETLVQLEDREQQMENEIDVLLNRESDFSEAIKEIYSKMPNLDYLLDDTRQLSGKIHVTSKIATNVSTKIRKLDCAKERVAACLKRIGDILDLKFCTQNIEKALLNNDYEQAAAHIHRFLSIDENNLKKSSLINENFGESLPLLES